MKISGNITLILFSLIITTSGTLFAQTEEELLDQLLLGEGGGGILDDNKDYQYTEALPPFSLSGFGEFESGLSLNETPFEENYFFQNQGRIKLKPIYESGDIRAYADIDYFTNSGSSEETNETNSLDCVEVYVEGTGFLFWKIGKQRFNWGAGDAYQPTDLIDRPDLRESFMRDNDDRYTGVYALSLKYLIGNYAVEAGIRPVTEKALGPAGYYAVKPENTYITDNDLSVRYRDSDIITDIDSISAALRFGGTSGIFDWHLMGYSGMNRELLYRSILTTESSGQYLDLQPAYERMNAIGADLSFALSKFNVRLEGIYSPDMPALSAITDGDITSAATAIASGASSADLQSIKHREYFNYTAGFDINLWGNYGTVYMEWMQGRYSNEDTINPILLTDILLIRAEDSLFDQALNLSASAIVRTRDEKPGLGIKSEAEYDFKNGMTMALGTFLFISNGDEYIKMINNKNLVYLDLKFEF